MGHVDLAVPTATGLHPHAEPDEYVTEHHAVIRYSREKDQRVRRVGRLWAYRVHAGLARNHGVSLSDVMDAHSQLMADLYEILFTDDNYRDAIADAFHAVESDLLVLDTVVLHPRWRGLKLGLLAVRKAIDLLGSGCGLAVADVWPLSPDARDEVRAPQSWLPRHDGGEAEREAVRRLRRYFRPTGFRRVRKTAVYAMSMALVTPTAEELLRPKNEVTDQPR